MTGNKPGLDQGRQGGGQPAQALEIPGALKDPWRVEPSQLESLPMILKGGKQGEISDLPTHSTPAWTVLEKYVFYSSRISEET